MDGRPWLEVQHGDNGTVLSSDLNLGGTVTISVEEVEESSMFFVPAGEEGNLHELLHSHILQLCITFCLGVLQQEPASLQGMTWTTRKYCSVTYANTNMQISKS